MKKLLLAIFASGISMATLAQDTTSSERADTIKVGGIIIIKGKNKNDTSSKNITISNKSKRKGNVSTNWWIVDLGFANYNDNTNYSSTEAQSFAPGFTSKDGLELRNGKSVNVNIWMFMQRINLIKHVVNLKYGVGVELNNYRFEDKRVRFTENPTQIILDEEWKDVKKNKLAADYVTVPAMLNFNFTPKKNKAYGLSAGVSAGYLYSARQKIKNDGDKDKTHDNFDLNKWKISYIGELNLGVIKLYGSYATKSMWEKGLDQTPYNVGIRFASW